MTTIISDEPHLPNYEPYMRAGLSRPVEHVAARFDYISRRYHWLYSKKRGDHKHRGKWEACPTLICEENRNALAYLLSGSQP